MQELKLEFAGLADAIRQRGHQGDAHDSADDEEPPLPKVHELPKSRPIQSTLNQVRTAKSTSAG